MTPLCFTLFDSTLQWTLDNNIDSFMVVFAGEAFAQYPDLQKHIQKMPSDVSILTLNLHPNALVGKLIYRPDTTLEFAMKFSAVVYQFKLKLTDIIGVALPTGHNLHERTIIAFPKQTNINPDDLSDEGEVVIGHCDNPTILEAMTWKDWVEGQHPDPDMDKRLSFVPPEDFPNEVRFEYYILTNRPHATLVGRSAEDPKPRLFVVKKPEEVKPTPIKPAEPAKASKAVSDYSRYGEYQAAKDNGYKGPYNVWYTEKTEAEARSAELAKGPKPLLDWDILAKPEPVAPQKGVLPVTNLADYRKRKEESKQ